MKLIKLLVMCTTLLAPASSFAAGVSLSAGAGGIFAESDNRLKTALELSPFYEVSILRLEVPIEMSLKPDTQWAVRPGLKLFIPVAGIYARGGVGFGNLGGDTKSKSLILGAGWQISLMDTVGVFFEGTGEPPLDSSGSFTAMLRIGAMVNL
jgi:hypothetical protein